MHVISNIHVYLSKFHGIIITLLYVTVFSQYFWKFNFDLKTQEAVSLAIE